MIITIFPIRQASRVPLNFLVTENRANQGRKERTPWFVMRWLKMEAQWNRVTVHTFQMAIKYASIIFGILKKYSKFIAYEDVIIMIQNYFLIMLTIFTPANDSKFARVKLIVDDGI